MLRAIDWTIMVVYFVFVLGIGAVLKRHVKTSTDFFLAGRSIPAWVAGLAFLSANLGAQEVIGMGASGAKYGIATSHFYWIGAIPAMLFLGVVMMPDTVLCTASGGHSAIEIVDGAPRGQTAQNESRDVVKRGRHASGRSVRRRPSLRRRITTIQKK